MAAQAQSGQPCLRSSGYLSMLDNDGQKRRKKRYINGLPHLFYERLLSLQTRTFQTLAQPTKRTHPTSFQPNSSANMQFTLLLVPVGLIFASSCQAAPWAQAANGQWIANNTFYNIRGSTLCLPSHFPPLRQYACQKKRVRSS